MFGTLFISITSVCMITNDSVPVNKEPALSYLLGIPGIVSAWDFHNPDALVSKGKYKYRLQEAGGSINVVQEGVLSGSSIVIREGQYLYIPRKECPALDIHGKKAAVTVLAWVKRQSKKVDQCEAIAGIWNETEKQRQYCLFVNLQIYESANQVCGHISGVGGPTPGQRWCMDASIGKKEVTYDEWHFIGFTYDGVSIKSYYDGELDTRPERNPYTYPEGIYDGGEAGADFTVAAVHRQGEMGNFFTGQMGGLAIYNRALDEAEIRKIHSVYPLPLRH